jgi:ubiquinone/menaquinone biosynthesis C-methylase UbiE
MTKEASFSYVDGTPMDKLLHVWRSFVVSSFIKTGLLVCDLGCGKENLFLKNISNKISYGIGIDFGKNGLSYANKVEYMQGDLNGQLPLPDKSVDVVTSLAVLEHINNTLLFMCESKRILRDGGLLLLTTPASHGKFILDFLSFFHLINADEVHDHKQYFNRQKLEDIAKNAGFNEYRVKRFQFSFNLLLIAKK